MNESPPLETIDYVTHNKVHINVSAALVWKLILDINRWRTTERLVPLSGEPGKIGERFHAVSSRAPDVPMFVVENVELVAEQRRTIRLDTLNGSFMGFASWELVPSTVSTLVTYDVYCRSALLPHAQSREELLAASQIRMHDGLLRLKAMAER